MSEAVLKLRNLTKTYIIGTRKNAVKAQKEIQKLHKKYEDDCEKQRKQRAMEDELLLKKAQQLFAEENFEDSYKTITGKTLKPRPKDRGTVVHALNGVNLQINKGELVAIMGPSGSGKSSLLNMLGLLDEPTAGQIFLNSKKVTSIKKSELPYIRSKELGFVFQSFNLVTSLTALENVMLPLKYTKVKKSLRRSMAEEALTKVGLKDRINHNPNELSGGQQQRVAIARSIVNKPSIILGDELTGELDSKMTAEIMQLILDLNGQGQTFIIVTHNPEVAKMCRRIILMKDGQVLKELHKKV